METCKGKEELDGTIISEELINDAIKQANEALADESIKDPKRVAKFVEGYRGESVGRVIEDLVFLMNLLPKEMKISVAMTYLPMELKLALAIAGIH